MHDGLTLRKLQPLWVGAICGLLLAGLWAPELALALNHSFKKTPVKKIAIMGRNDMKPENGRYRQVVLVKTSDGAQGAGLVFGARCDRVLTTGHLLFSACGVPKKGTIRVQPRPWSVPGWSLSAKRIYGQYGKQLSAIGTRCLALPQIDSRTREQLHLNELTILALPQPALSPGSCNRLKFPFQLSSHDQARISWAMKNHRLGLAKAIGFKRSFFAASKRVSATGNLYFRQAGDWTYYRSPWLFQYDIDTLPGFSGGPIIIRYQNSEVVLGINILERFIGQDRADNTDYQAFSRANIGLRFPAKISEKLQAVMDRAVQRNQSTAAKPWKQPEPSQGPRL